MSPGECRNTWCAKLPTVTELHEHNSAEIAPITRMPRGLGRVLVVDDDEMIGRLIAVNLTLEGFDVAMAVDGQDCLDNVSAIAPDIITLDVMVPHLDGTQTAIRLRENPDTAHIKVVLITARAPDDDRTPDEDVGADAYVTKPFDPGTLIQTIRNLVAD
jgi:DNA-binding response OmpR family regulator